MPADPVNLLSDRSKDLRDESPVRMQWSLQSLPSLSKFTVGVDESVESFPEEMLLPSTLEY
jgi:hypothetical protein